MDSALSGLLDSIFPVMLYPDDPAARTSAYRSAIFAGSGEALRDSWQADPNGQQMMLASYRLATDTGKAPPEHLRDFHNRFNAANMAALILAALVEMEQMGIPKSVNVAVKLARKEEHRAERWIRESWSRFKCTAPLWLAWNLFMRDMRDSEAKGTSLPQNPYEVGYFLRWARYFFDFATRVDGVDFENSVRAVHGVDLGRFYMAIPPSPNPFEMKILSDLDRELICAIRRPAGRPTANK